MSNINDTLEGLLAQLRARLDTNDTRITLTITLEQSRRALPFKIKHNCKIGEYYEDNKTEFTSESIELSCERALRQFLEAVPDLPSERHLMLPVNGDDDAHVPF